MNFSYWGDLVINNQWKLFIRSTIANTLIYAVVLFVHYQPSIPCGCLPQLDIFGRFITIFITWLIEIFTRSLPISENCPTENEFKCSVCASCVSANQIAWKVTIQTCFWGLQLIYCLCFVYIKHKNSRESKKLLEFKIVVGVCFIIEFLFGFGFFLGFLVFTIPIQIPLVATCIDLYAWHSDKKIITPIIIISGPIVSKRSTEGNTSLDSEDKIN